MVIPSKVNYAIVLKKPSQSHYWKVVGGSLRDLRPSKSQEEHTYNE